MSGTFFRSGLWIVVLALGLYVTRETVGEGPLREFLSTALLTRAGAFGLLLLVAGIVMSFLEKGASKVLRARCRVCSRAVPSGEMFCRAHLRNILEEEHDRTHAPTRTRRPS